MAKKLQIRRLVALTLLLGAAFMGLGYRLVDLQVLRHDELQREARQNTARSYLLVPRRGDILDAKGNLLATSVFVKTVCADPTLIGNRQAEVAHALAPLLQMDAAALMARLAVHTHTNEQGETVTNQYVLLKHKVPGETWQKITNAMAQLVLPGEERATNKTQKAFYTNLRAKAIYTEALDDQLRTYPSQGLAAHVLGYTGLTTGTNGGETFQEAFGVDGIERALNQKLKGVRGWRQTEVDGNHQELVAQRELNVEPHDGLNVVLTIDSFIQHTLETTISNGWRNENAISASGVVLRPATGEILAMAVVPGYDPNNPGASPEASRHNRIIQEVHEPGSTFKVITISGALNEQIVTLTDQFDCEHGHFAFAGRILHDHASYGVLSTEGIITRSSNIGAAKIGIKMGEPILYEYMRNFGVGQRTEIPLPGEVPGLLHPLKQWSKVSIAQIPMGQGVATTSLQMALAISAIANKGVLMRPMLVDRLQDANGEVVARYSPETVRRVISEDAARQMTQALKTVVTADGTAPKAAMDHYTVAGKTGTAQKIENGQYSLTKYYASFIGFFPADNPEICIYLSLDEPKGNLHQGGQVCAPMFKEVAEQVAAYLNIRPDKGGDTPLELPVTNAPPAMGAVAARTP